MLLQTQIPTRVPTVPPTQPLSRFGAYTSTYSSAYTDTICRALPFKDAPPGMLGLVLETSTEGMPTVHALGEDSALAHEVLVGERLTHEC